MFIAFTSHPPAQRPSTFKYVPQLLHVQSSVNTDHPSLIGQWFTICPRYGIISQELAPISTPKLVAFTAKH